MLYHYVGNKEALYARVLLDAYRDIRAGEAELHLGELAAGARRWRAWSASPSTTSGRTPGSSGCSPPRTSSAAPSSRELPDIRALHSPLVAQITEVLAAGEAGGLFRPGVDPVQLYITIAGISYFYMSNIHTLSVIFDAPLAGGSEDGRAAAHAIEVVLGYLRPANPLAMK